MDYLRGGVQVIERRGKRYTAGGTHTTGSARIMVAPYKTCHKLYNVAQHVGLKELDFESGTQD